MERGKFIFWLAVIPATVIATWEWFIGKMLDRFLATPGGPLDRVSAVLAMFGPLEQFVLGMSVGMLIALIIGYWHSITYVIKYIFMGIIETLEYLFLPPR